jgi:hypothetical protein
VEAVARAVDPQRRAAGAEDERDREPDAVSAVVHHGRVAGAWAEAGEEAALPAPAGVAGDGEADRVRAPVEDPADLEDRDDGLAERERVGLDLGRVPALARAERIARGAPGDDLAVAGDAVELVDCDEVAPAAAEDPVTQAVDGLEPVGTARAADSRRGGGRGRDEQERERDE